MSNEITGYATNGQNMDSAETMNSLEEMELTFWAAFPNGKLTAAVVHLNERLAIIESRVYFDKGAGDDGYAVNRMGFAIRGDEDTSGEYIKRAERSGLIQALTETKAVWQNSSKKERTRSQGKPGKKAALNADMANGVETAPGESPAMVPEMPAVPTSDPDGQSMPGPGANKSPAAAPSPLPVPQPAPETGEKVIPLPDSSSPTVEEILASMTVEEAVEAIIDFGADKGKTVGQVARTDPGKLAWLRDSYKGPNNQVKAAAALLLLQAGDVPA